MSTFIPNRTLIAVSGGDALSLLQRLVTADLAALEAGDGARYTLLLTPQGKYRFDFFIVKAGDQLYLDTPAGQAEELIQALTMYRLRAQVEFAQIEGTVWLGEAPASGIVSFKDPRHATLGWRTWQVAVSGDGAAYTALRVRLGIVEPSDDLPTANANPLDYGLDTLGAISFTKGCYLGQELTARMHNRDLAKYEVKVMPVAETYDGTLLIEVDGSTLVQVRRSGK